jgi:ketosteroid isomerase-like protein
MRPRNAGFASLSYCDIRFDTGGVACKPLKTCASNSVGLEKQYWNAIKDRDASTAAALSEDPCVVVGAQGVSELDSARLAKMLDSATYELKDFELDDIHVRRVTDDVAVVAYEVSEDLVVEGKKVKLKAYDSSVWLRRGGQWACVVHTESIAGDPFGRR